MDAYERAPRSDCDGKRNGRYGPFTAPNARIYPQFLEMWSCKVLWSRIWKDLKDAEVGLALRQPVPGTCYFFGRLWSFPNNPSASSRSVPRVFPPVHCLISSLEQVIAGIVKGLSRSCYFLASTNPGCARCERDSYRPFCRQNLALPR